MEIMQHLKLENYSVMPWKNGGGTTTELASSSDQNGALDSFIWRISIANVTIDGPFSKFEGYDRILTMIKGNGMQLQLKEAEDINVSYPFVPHAFRGELQIDGTLNDGPVDNFNLIFDREKANGQVCFCPAREVTQNLDRQSDIIFLHNLSNHAAKFDFGSLNVVESLLTNGKTPLNNQLQSEDDHQMALVQIILK